MAEFIVVVVAVVVAVVPLFVCFKKLVQNIVSFALIQYRCKTSVVTFKVTFRVTFRNAVGETCGW